MQINDFKKRPDFKGEITYKGILNILKKEFKNSGHILDAGAGNGILFNKLKALFPSKEIIGIDKDPQASGIIEQDLTDTHFSNSYFDLIICSDVIEHLTEETLSKGLLEFNRILKKNGKLFISTLLEEDTQKNLCKCPDCGKSFHRIGHVQIFTENELIQLLEEKGFIIEKIIKTHLGLFSVYPFLMNLIKILKLDKILYRKIRNLFEKDILIICSK